MMSLLLAAPPVIAVWLAGESTLPAVLALCVAMTIALIFYVFYLPEQLESSGEKTRLMFLSERKDTVYENLRDLNFEYKAGKLPEGDYQQMRTSLEEEAASLLAEIDRLQDANAAPFSRFADAPVSGSRTGKVSSSRDRKGISE